MKIKIIVMLFILLHTLPSNSQELLKTSKTWEGKDVIYPKGQAEITSVKLSIAANTTTKFHCHPVPTIAYILQGKLEVETQKGKKRTFNAGESIAEVLRTVHRGKAIDEAVEIVVFYVGSTTMPNTVLVSDAQAEIYCSN